MICEITKRKKGILISVFVVLIAFGISYLAIDNLYDHSGKPASAGLEEEFTDKLTEEESRNLGEESNQEDTFNKNIPFISLGIGISMGIVSLLMWEGGTQPRNDPISLLIHKGLEDLTVRDLNITRQMMIKNEFTIPELLKHTSASRQSVWRLVNKLQDEGMVEETSEKRLPKSGRGKPSQIYRYVGPDLRR
ncbi:MAG: hypothetical protein ACLFUR_00160 [Candidatus Hadarchaeia archaeon]